MLAGALLSLAAFVKPEYLLRDRDDLQLSGYQNGILIAEFANRRNEQSWSGSGNRRSTQRRPILDDQSGYFTGALPIALSFKA